MNKLLILIFFVFTLNANALEKKTTFDKELFNQAQSEGKIVVVSSWIKYCQSCAGQMKILNKAKNEGVLSDIKLTFTAIIVHFLYKLLCFKYCHNNFLRVCFD